MIISPGIEILKNDEIILISKINFGYNFLRAILHIYMNCKTKIVTSNRKCT